MLEATGGRPEVSILTRAGLLVATDPAPAGRPVRRISLWVLVWKTAAVAKESIPGEDVVVVSLRFPVGERDGAAEIELPEELADELRRTLADSEFVPYTRIWESFDPGTATIVGAIITANGAIFAATLAVFISRKQGRSVRIEQRPDGNSIEISGHSQRQEERILDAMGLPLEVQKLRNEQRRKESQEMFDDDE